MKRFFSIIGFISLISFSFIFTENISNVALEMNSLVMEIKEKKNEYDVKVMEAVISDNTIIPGISGKSVNVLKSYNNMKKVGKFIPNMLIYDKVNPTNTLDKNKDKYIISGNKNKNMVSLVFLVDNENIEDIIRIINKNKIQVNFFINYDYAVNNYEILKDLKQYNHIIGNIDSDYENILLTDTIIKTKLKQDKSFCYNEGNKGLLNACLLQGNYTIKPKIIIKNNPYITVKQNLESGSIIFLKVNNSLKKELQSIINFIKSKGLKIENLNTLLEDK